ncbi:MAG TPA: PaaI family thioesterase [Micromonosporaceae bacterium]
MTDTKGRTRTYSWADPLVPAARVAEMSGLELFAAMQSGELPHPPIMDTLGVERITANGEGSVTVLLQPAEFHYNPLGSMHGGVISTLLDTAAACAVHTTLPAGMAYTSLDLTVRFLKPITTASGMLRCEGIVVSRGRSTALGEAKLYDAADRLVAHGTSTCMIFPAR